MSNRIKTKKSKEKKKVNNISKNNKKENKAIDDETLSTVRSELKKKNISLNKQQEELMIQIFKFIVVGGIATVIDWIIYFVLYHFVKIEPIIANIISFAVSVVYNYWASCKYVFKVNKEKSRARQFVDFLKGASHSHKRHLDITLTYTIHLRDFGYGVKIKKTSLLLHRDAF